MNDCVLLLRLLLMIITKLVKLVNLLLVKCPNFGLNFLVETVRLKHIGPGDEFI